VNTAKILLGDANQTYYNVKAELDTAIKEFDQALADQTRELILGKAKKPQNSY